MDDGKPTGPQAKWWSRPTGPKSESQATTASPAVTEDASAGTQGAPEAAAPAVPGTPDPVDTRRTPDAPAPDASAPDAPAPGAVGGLVASGSSSDAYGHPGPASCPEGQPLHQPDEYSTPPYGGPGPWAPAPPVQRPTPPHGTAVPPQAGGPSPQYAATNGAGIPAPAPGPAPRSAPEDSFVAPPPQPSDGFAPLQAQHPQPPANPGPPANPAHATHPGPDAHAPQQHTQQHTQWLQYDPWGAPGQPLTRGGPPEGAEPGRKKRRRGGAFAGVLLLTLVASGIGGGVGAYVERNGGLTTVELPQAGRDSGDRAPESVAGIAASALPSVVTLHVSGTAESGTGTGFVLDGQGHILTNNHVVAPAGSSGDITVTFSSGETASAELVGKDSGYDLAVVKVRGVSGLKPLPLGNSDNVRVGDPVVAIGAPFDLSNTVTSGIISAKQRPITAGGEKGDGSDISYVDALQTDAPINPGNSGGPLVDTKAHVIGINSAIRAADSGKGPESGGQSGSIGLGFAIPINQGKRVAEELINTGRATHPVIGVTLDMKFTGDGAKVGTKGADGGPAVAKDGPADKAGIRSGDVITEVEGQRVHSGEELIVKIRAHRPGDDLDLVLTRGGEERTVTLTLGSASGT
ncbi:trypsin-like peptidase domain-containing protein [Streptomyces sp. C11-1]|uniref:Trypsin-like peptidase domain-containing protein n=1 Tax=Streptomyces durocortorensis TaxID=2811104 RepID=A0ABY9VZS9_9ACTN|nr:trypsin-like peptidase domain-containing protein [Streptomyces durocortorensis]WNF29411.1 trypsin-like peptidase domain-containing protein [Streptomyces durocortorensis]